MQNYFEIFQLPLSFQVDLKTLKARYLDLQTKVHPDQQHDIQQKSQAMQESVRINDAYQVLLDPLKRARHILKLNNIEIKSEETCTLSPEFLFKQMELRESIAESESDVAKLNALQFEITKSIAQQLEFLEKIFMATPFETTVIIQKMNEMSFYQKLKSEVEQMLWQV